MQNNYESAIAFVFFILFIGVAIWISLLHQPSGKIQLLSNTSAIIIGIGLLILNLAIAGASLINIKDSWRVGVIEDQKTELITTGIYQFTRNPYFVSYLIMLIAYTIILQNWILLILSIFGFFVIARMIKKEEKYLYSIHGDVYLQYKTRVPRYLII